MVVRVRHADAVAVAVAVAKRAWSADRAVRGEQWVVDDRYSPCHRATAEFAGSAESAQASRHTKALRPVNERPTIRVFISLVPSYE